MKSPLLLERIATLIHQSVRDDARRHGLQPIHWQILDYLSRANHYSDFALAIAEYCGITRGTVSQSLRVLEQKGLVRRRPDSRHGRRIHLEPTRAGLSVLQSGWSQRLRQALVDEELDDERLGQILERLLGALQRQNQQRAFGVCRHCAHFLHEAKGHRCGLTGEMLREEHTLKICREWTDPGTAV